MELITLHEATRLLNVSPDTIHRWARKGLLASARPNQSNAVFSKDELLQVHKTHRTGRPEGRYRVLTAEPTPYTSVELFSGAGGLALGLEHAGFQTQCLVDADTHAAHTLMANRPQWNVLHKDIADVDFTAWRSAIDLVAGGFPCQAFSYAGKQHGFGDVRGTLFFEFARAVDEIRPKLVLGENVRGLLNHDAGRTLFTMVRTLDDLGYEVRYRYLRAQFMDVPQKRERLFLLGVRKDLDTAHLFPQEKDYTVALRDALADCPKSSGTLYPEWKRKVMDQVPEGGNWRDLPADAQQEYMCNALASNQGGRTGFARRLSWSEPAPTLTCNPAQKQTECCHPSETRPLSIREYARVQTFPDSWAFAGPVAKQYKQIGNAVPVNLGFTMGRALIRMLSGQPDDYVECLRAPEKPLWQWPLI